MDNIFNILNDLRPEHNFKESNNFILDGMLDSFDIVSLVTALEEKYGILIDALDILPENFYSVSAIAAIVRKNGGNL